MLLLKLKPFILSSYLTLHPNMSSTKLTQHESKPFNRTEISNTSRWAATSTWTWWHEGAVEGALPLRGAHRHRCPAREAHTHLTRGPPRPSRDTRPTGRTPTCFTSTTRWVMWSFILISTLQRFFAHGTIITIIFLRSVMTALCIQRSIKSV